MNDIFEEDYQKDLDISHSCYNANNSPNLPTVPSFPNINNEQNIPFTASLFHVNELEQQFKGYKRIYLFVNELNNELFMFYNKDNIYVLEEPVYLHYHQEKFPNAVIDEKTNKLIHPDYNIGIIQDKSFLSPIIEKKINYSAHSHYRINFIQIIGYNNKHPYNLYGLQNNFKPKVFYDLLNLIPITQYLEYYNNKYPQEIINHNMYYNSYINFIDEIMLPKRYHYGRDTIKYMWMYISEYEKKNNKIAIELNNLVKIYNMCHVNDIDIRPYYNDEHMICYEQVIDLDFNSKTEFDLNDQDAFNEKLAFVLNDVKIEDLHPTMILYGSTIAFCSYCIPQYKIIRELYYKNSDIDITIPKYMIDEYMNDFGKQLKDNSSKSEADRKLYDDYCDKVSNVYFGYAINNQETNEYIKTLKSKLYKIIINKFNEKINGTLKIKVDDEFYPKYIVTSPKGVRFEIHYSNELNMHQFSFSFLRGYYCVKNKTTYCYPSMLYSALNNNISFDNRWRSDNTSFEEIMEKYIQRGFKVLIPGKENMVKLVYDKFAKKYQMKTIKEILEKESPKPLIFNLENSDENIFKRSNENKIYVDSLNVKYQTENKKDKEKELENKNFADMINSLTNATKNLKLNNDILEAIKRMEKKQYNLN